MTGKIGDIVVIHLDEQLGKFDPQSCEDYAKTILQRLEAAKTEHPEAVQNPRVLTEPFYFVHFTDRELDIQDEGFMGQTSEIFDTRKKRGELHPEGHIFAFRIDSDSLESAYNELDRIYEDAESGYDEEADEEGLGITAWTPFGIYGAGIVIAKACMGVEFFHGGDQEMQVLIPIACIDTDEMLVDCEFLENWGLEMY
jgi:hypothetical protein